MLMAQRDRSEGWRHAKLSGHDLEDRLSDRLQSDAPFASRLHDDCFGESCSGVAHVESGGLTASHCPCVLGGVTPAKRDLLVQWPNGREARISLKKSAGGQVWLVTGNRFFDAFEAQIGRPVPPAARSVLSRFIGPLSADELDELHRRGLLLGPLRRDGTPQELHQERLVAATLRAIAPRETEEAIEWLRSEMPAVARLCFSTGLCSNPSDQAEFVWYHLEDENTRDEQASLVIPVRRIIRRIEDLPSELRASIGPRNGGSTINLPFGFLQMHRPSGGNQFQFHHRLRDVNQLMAS